MGNTILSDNFWREYGHPYLPQRKSSHRVEGEVTTCNQSIRDFLLLLICRCSALSYCQFWMCWLWNFKLGFIIFFCHVLANCLDTNQCYSWVYTAYQNPLKLKLQTLKPVLLVSLWNILPMNAMPCWKIQIEKMD